MSAAAPAPRRGNAILDALTPTVRARLTSAAQRRPLELGDIVYDIGAPFTHTVFPVSGVVAQLTRLENGAFAESGTVGRESCIGPTSALMHRIASRRFEVRVPGHALFVPLDVLDAVVRTDFDARNVFMQEAQASLNAALQLAVCNHAHAAQQRLARWLLQAHDRVEEDAFYLKQATLAESLGLRRATVSDCCSALAEAGAIRYVRGRMRIVDRERLRGFACECYAAMAEPHSDAALSQPGRAEAAEGTQPTS